MFDRGTIVGALFVSIVQGLETAELASDSLLQFMQNIPFYKEEMEWLLLAILGGVIGLFIPKRAKASNEKLNNAS
ncbi:branched-chain amino acid transport system II carrier protein [Bacillus wiedmannii]|uniref:branched-chain amino acid transport system II carrier protein n=1 Tax=Bacillus wiedmannii TaxID=1890302 RepID=UPI003BF4D0DC